MTLSKRDEIKLHVRSYGRCNFCYMDLYGSPNYAGENAHITARRISGPRGGLVPEFDTDTYENHILLCPTHHTNIDKAPDLYPSDELLRIKYEFETRVSQMISFEADRGATATYLSLLLRYSSICNFDYYVKSWPPRIHMDLMDLGYFADLLNQELAYLLPLRDRNIGVMLNSFYEAFDKLERVLTGHTQADRGVYSNFTQVGLGDYIEVNPGLSGEARDDILQASTIYISSLRNLLRMLLAQCRIYHPDALI